MRLTLLTVGIFFSFYVLNAQIIHHWETAVYDSSRWRYFPGTSDPGTAWMTPDFNDDAWSEGRGSVGYGDSDDRTTISPVLSVFLRKSFTVHDISKIERAVLHVDYDDGFIAYLNGVEVARADMGSDVTVPYNQPSAALHEALLYQGGRPEAFLLENETLAGLLSDGINVLALQVHNENISSTDLTAAAFFSFEIKDNTTEYGTLPAWFSEPASFTSSNLPIIKINTNGQTIMDEPDIVAHMDIINNGAGNRNHVTDLPNDYSGKIRIEIRGESSQMFPKKSFRVETQDDLGENLNVPLLGMPAENDWVLYAPYTDKTMMRNVLTYKLGNDMGRYAPRTRFAEVVINGNYQGVYVLIEKIKRDRNRVDIATLNPDDISGDDLTGGYILRVDKIDGNDYPAWASVPSPQLAGENIINFQYSDPEGAELVDVQRAYIRNFIKAFESSLTSTQYKEVNGFKKHIDIPAFVDFMLVNEIGKNVDGFVYSTYLYKEKDSKGGKLFMGPLWDFNLAFGNVDYWQNAQVAPGWMWNDQYRMYWFRRMVTDPAFSRALKCRWETLRSTWMTDDYFSHTVDSIATVLQEAQERNYQQWPILGTYIWPNQYIGLTYQHEVSYLKQWIKARLQWMDNNMPGTCDVITGTETDASTDVIIYPNPVVQDFSIAGATGLISWEIVNAQGFSVLRGTDRHGIDMSMLSPGIYTVMITHGNSITYRRFVKR